MTYGKENSAVYWKTRYRLRNEAVIEAVDTFSKLLKWLDDYDLWSAMDDVDINSEGFNWPEDLASVQSENANYVLKKLKEMVES